MIQKKENYSEDILKKLKQVITANKLHDEKLAKLLILYSKSKSEHIGRIIDRETKLIKTHNFSKVQTSRKLPINVQRGAVFLLFSYIQVLFRHEKFTD